MKSSQNEMNLNSTLEVSTEVTSDDATWILTSSFVIFTMQTGFGLLESGACSKKNEVNILMKNVADVVLGGLFYWALGYGLQFGNEEGVTGWYGWGNWFLDSSQDKMGPIFATFIFQLSFCTTATTIVSGSMAERTNYKAYIVFSALNTIVYCIPAGWIWRDSGWLYRMGALDFAGCACVHLIGGISALVAAYMLKPRLKRYERGTDPLPMGNPVNAVVGCFALWWGWLGFNCGSTFGVSHNKWQFAERAAVTTLNGSFAGGLVALLYSFISSKKAEVGPVLNGILAGLVAVTSGAGFFLPLDSFVIGSLGCIANILIPPVMDRFRIDDPVGAVAVHAGAGLIGALCVGLFAVDIPNILPNGGLTRGQSGLLKGGGFRLLGVQFLATICVSLWSGITTWMLLAAIDKVIPIRMCVEEEILGADIWIHDIRHDYYDFDSIITEMIRENLDICDHIKRSNQKQTVLHYNHFIVDKFLISPQNNQWWKRLTRKQNFKDYASKGAKPKRALALSDKSRAVRIAWINASSDIKRIGY